VTDNMAAVLLSVNMTNATGKWHRAESSGQRVTLAALWRAGRVERRVWRHAKHECNNAHEYANPTYIKRGIVTRHGDKP
jgi:hypothetical protein